MKTKVMKFGGTSVASSEARQVAALRVISAKEQGFRPVVVISAIGRKGAPYATDTLIQLLREIDPKVEPDTRELDQIMACGEILSSVIFAQTLKTLGHPAQAFRGDQAGICTDGVYGDARIVAIEPAAIQKSLEAGYIPVICGFQGMLQLPGLPAGELTTLGRGGSDTTASAVGAALGSECVEIFTDVDGVKTCDPDSVPSAPTLNKVGYDEVAEIAHLGAKVLHPRAAEIAMKYSIPLWVKNTFSDLPGTEIVPGGHSERTITGIAHTGKLVYVDFNLSALSESLRTQIAASIFSVLAENNINLFMTNIGQSALGFAVPREQFPRFRELFDGLIYPEGNTFHLFQVGDQSSTLRAQENLLPKSAKKVRVEAKTTEGCTIVSVVGKQYLARAGVFFGILRTLAENSIPVLQTSDSEYSFSCLIPEAECYRAVRLLHETLGLSEVQ